MIKETYRWPIKSFVFKSSARPGWHKNSHLHVYWDTFETFFVIDDEFVWIIVPFLLSQKLKQATSGAPIAIVVTTAGQKCLDFNVS